MKIVNRLAVLAGMLFVTGSQSHAQGFGNLYAFGDSLTDCCAGVGGPFINRPDGGAPAASWLTTLAPQIGTSYTPTLSNNLAIGGAQSGTDNVNAAVGGLFGQPTGFLSQVGRFSKPVSSRDIVGIWIGTNDIWPSALANPGPSFFAPLGIQPPVGTLTDYVIGNIRSGVNQLVADGFRNVVLVSPYDLGSSTTTGTDSALASQYSVAVRDQLARLYTPGVNTYFLDTLTLMNRVQANPSAYGFTHFLASDSCSANPACASGPLSLQSTYVFNDGIHLTGAFDALMSRYIANIINAREAFSAPGDISQGASLTFSNGLIDRLDAQRRMSNPYNAQAAYMPVKAVPGPIAALPDKFSVFVEGTGAGISRSGGPTPNGPSNSDVNTNFVGLTAGAQYQAAPNLSVGVAFNFLNSKTDLPGLSHTHVDSNSYQGGVFASLSYPNFFLDGAMTYGLSQIDTRRPGVIDTINGSLDGNTFTIASRTGYLFDVGQVKAGPIAEFAYSNVSLGSYAETGDSLLTLGVNKQNFDGLTGGVGMQVRASLPFAQGTFNPFINLTAEHDFIGGVRSIASFSTNAPLLLINTTGGSASSNLYGKVAGGFDVNLGNGLKGIFSGSTTFARSTGNAYAASGGLQYQF